MAYTPITGFEDVFAGLNLSSASQPSPQAGGYAGYTPLPQVMSLASRPSGRGRFTPLGDAQIAQMMGQFGQPQLQPHAQPVQLYQIPQAHAQPVQFYQIPQTGQFQPLYTPVEEPPIYEAPPAYSPTHAALEVEYYTADAQPAFHFQPAYAVDSELRKSMTQEGFKRRALSMMINDQVGHVARAQEILVKHPVVNDFSVPGCGKTYTTCALAAQLDFDLFVVCEKVQIGVWQRVAAEFGVTVLDICTYAAMTRDQQLTTTDGTHYMATQYWYNTLWADTATKRPVLLVFDESHNLKNKTAKTKVAHAMLAPMTGKQDPTNPCPSRCIMLSGTPFDKPEHAETFYRAFGLLAVDSQLAAYDVASRSFDYSGFIEAQENLQVMIPTANLNDGTQARLAGKKSGAIKTILYNWFTKYIKPTLCISMEVPPATAELDVGAAYFPMPPEAAIEFRKHLQCLMNEMRYDNATGQIAGKTDQAGRTSLFNILPLLEELKVWHIVAPYAWRLLATSDRGKVVILVKNLASIQYLLNYLAPFNPLAISGDTSTDDRTRNISLFQTDPRYRVFLATIGTGTTGISLDDTVGDQPRTCIMIPDHSIQLMHQGSRRCYRAQTKSKAVVRIVYAAILSDEGDELSEQGMIDALVRKTAVYNDILTTQVEAGVKFPGEYDRVNYPVQEQPTADDCAALSARLARGA